MDQLLNLTKDESVVLFNSELLIFLSELIKIVTAMNIDTATLNKLLSYKSLIDTGISANKEIGVEMCASYIIMPENENIIQKVNDRDYDFFYSMDSTTIDNTNQFTDILLIIKDLFMQLSETNKENVFAYLENLILLGNVYVMKKLKK